MFKLIKYELRKMRTALLVLLAVLAALEAYFLISAARASEVDVIASLSLMMFGFIGVALCVFAMGISAYSRELRHKSSYLVFMTPNSTLAVVASKLLFTVVLGIMFAAVTTLMLAVNVPVAFDYFGQWRGYYVLLDTLMLQQGVDIGALLAQLALYTLSMLLSLLSWVSVAYFSITLSATFLQNRRGRGLVSFLLFVLIAWGLGKLSSLWSVATLYQADVYDAQFALRALAPQIALSAAALLGSLFASAWLLKNRIDL